MSDLTRRHAFAAAAATTAAAAGLIAPAPAEAASEQAAEKAPVGNYKFRLAEAKLEQYSGGTLRKVVVEVFPASPQMSGGIINLDPGGMREPHWHPNAIEWDYVIAGRFRFSVLDPNGNADTFEATTGDVVVIPQGFAHSFENVGEGVATLLLTFNAGHFDEIGISEWIAKSPKETFLVPLNLDKEALANSPDHKLFITSKKTPGR